MSHRSSHFVAVALACLVPFACGPSGPTKEISYADDIQAPIFNFSCLSGCHDAAREGGLSLETYEDLMEGGTNGLVVVPRDAEGSRLVWTVQGFDDSEAPVDLMPPPGSLFPPLRPSQIQTIKKWIDDGAQNN